MVVMVTELWYVTLILCSKVDWCDRYTMFHAVDVERVSMFTREIRK